MADRTETTACPVCNGVGWAMQWRTYGDQQYHGEYWERCDACAARRRGRHPVSSFTEALMPCPVTRTIPMRHPNQIAADLTKNQMTLAAWEAALAQPGLEQIAIDFLARSRAACLETISVLEVELQDARAAASVNSRPVLTAEAVAHPEMVCFKCNGAGRINGFRHVDGGKCFGCAGLGIKRRRA